MSEELKPGDIVRVKDASRFITEFAKKIANRDATVIYVGSAHGALSVRARVRFHKRNGRGKEFEEVLRVSELERTQEP